MIKGLVIWYVKEPVETDQNGETQISYRDAPRIALREQSGGYRLTPETSGDKFFLDSDDIQRTSPSFEIAKTIIHELGHWWSGKAHAKDKQGNVISNDAIYKLPSLCAQ
jgi:hypothetical protein